MKITPIAMSLLCLACTTAEGQTKAVDSMRALIYGTGNPLLQKRYLIAALEMQRSVTLDTLGLYLQRLSALGPFSLKEHAAIDIGRVYYYTRSGQADSCEEIINRNMQGLNKAAPELLMNYQLLSGSTMLRRNEHRLALDRYFAVLSSAERAKNYGLQTKALNGIGWVYMEMSQYAKAVKWLRKAQSVQDSALPGDIFCPVYSNLASCYGALQQYDSAGYYVNKAIGCSRAGQDLTAEANSMVIKANLLLTLGKPGQAIATLRHAVALRKILNDPYYMLSDLCILSTIYATTGHAGEGLELAQEAMDIARRYNIAAKLPMIYAAYEANYRQNKDYRNLARVYAEHLAIKDSVYQKALAKELADKEARYGVEKKEREIVRQNLELQHERDSRKVLLFSLSGALLLAGAGGLMFLQRSKTQQQRKEFSAMLDAEQKERIRIARDLHDSIGQKLSVVKMNVSNIHYQAAAEEKRMTTLTLDIVDETIQELRHISHNLIPEELNFGLVNALEEMVRKVNEAGSTVVELRVAAGLSERKFDKQFELSLYRIIQEVLSNILKHAEARHAVIDIQPGRDNMRLSLADDGKGFDTGIIRSSGGLGWKNVQGRVRLLSGKMDVQSEKNKGTRIEIDIPL